MKDYYHTVALGLAACLRAEKTDGINKKDELKKRNENLVVAIVFGSGQGLVGRFNDSLTGFVSQSLNPLSSKKEIWAVGERMQLLLSDAGFSITTLLM